MAISRQALEIIRAAARRRPLDVNQARFLSIITSNTAMRLSELHHENEGIQEARTSLDFLDRLASDNPAVPHFREAYLRVAENLRYILSRQSGKAEELARLLDAEWAVIERLPRETASDWFRIAFWRTQLSRIELGGSSKPSADTLRQREALQAQAVAALSRAYELGSKDPTVLNSWWCQLLRPRDDFKALVARVETAGTERAESKPTPDPAGVNQARKASTLATLSPENRAMLRQVVGIVFSQLGKPDEAVASLTEAIGLREQLVRDNPANPRNLSDLALSLVALGDLECRIGRADAAAPLWTRAEPILLRATRERPEDLELWKGLSLLYGHTGQDEKAAATFERILTLLPRRPEDRHTAATRNKEIEELAFFERAFAKLVERNPGDDTLRLGRSRSNLLRDRWDLAAVDSARSVGSSPYDSEEWVEHAGLMLLNADPAGCREFLRGLLQREGGTHDPAIAYVVTRACNLSSEPVVPPSEILRMAEFSAGTSQDFWLLHVLGIAMYRAGLYREAIQTMERASNHLNHLGEKKFVLAMAYQRLGETQKARVLLDEGRAWFDQNRIGGVATRPSPDWVTTHVYHREAEALILHDPVFPADPFAR